MKRPVPYTIEPEYKAPTVASLALDLLFAAVGTLVIVAASAYGMGIWP